MWARLANRRQSHSCAPLAQLDDHLGSSAPEVRAPFDDPEKSRIALQGRMSFATLMPRRRTGWANNGTWTLAR